ncbi:hypothetical protein [Rhizobium ruizarguesonis]|uniref:hypothetical protein n=1 Tax=Rhizobium ruizarguesonis TaxID=2081791 RepID=UPI001031C102|nr:hypothetical protein [Rhizobium ruizarguesonis]TBC32085.1 hypothetical protein ELH35_24285 [Rhizobium ruizarguesonis]
MSMFYHIRQEGEYRLVHCSNASDANLEVDLASPLPFLLAKIKEPASVAGSPCGLQTDFGYFRPADLTFGGSHAPHECVKHGAAANASARYGYISWIYP